MRGFEDNRQVTMVMGHPQRNIAIIATGTSAIAVWILTSRGVGITPDSVTYLSAAASLSEACSLLEADGAPLSTFPPLYPVVLAGLHLAGIPFPVGVPVLNGLLLGVLVWATGIVVHRVTDQTSYALCAMTLVAVGAPIQLVLSYAWSEPLYLALTMSFAVIAPRAMQDRKERQLIFAGGLAGAAALTRYIGASVIITGLFLILAAKDGRSYNQRCRRGARFLVISGLPGVAPVSWTLRP
jgi:hypothetical protein